MEKADPPGITEAQESLALFFVQILFRPLLNHVIRRGAFAISDKTGIQKTICSFFDKISAQ